MVNEMAKANFDATEDDATAASRRESQAGNAQSASDAVNRRAPIAVNEESTTDQLGTKFQLRSNVLSRAVRLVPSILVFGSLAAIGYWGHHNHWKISAFSELTGSKKASVEGWCDEHGVPEDICISCRAELLPKKQLHGWCKEHGVAECVLEHPELAQLAETPVILDEDLEHARLALRTKERPKNDPTCKMHLRRIQFASREAVDKAGVDIGLVDRGRIVETVTANGEIRYDPTLVTRVASRARGSVWRVEKNVGDLVGEGDLLVLVDAALVGQAKAELLQAVAQLNLQENTASRLEDLEGVVPGRRLQEVEAAREDAQAVVRKATQTLANLGMPIKMADVLGRSGEEIAARIHFLGLPNTVSRRLDPHRTTANLVPVLSPGEGVVVTRDVVRGEVIDTTKMLFTVVDNHRMWLLLDVPLEDVDYVKVGQTVTFLPDGGTQEHTGQITWISTRIDADTRTVKVRAELPNPDGRLRDESFGAGRIVLREEESAIVAPKDAIHWEGCCFVAFVRDKEFLADDSYKFFHTRMVRPGVTNGDFTELIAGLLPGEVVVTKGSGVLRAELLKGNLGAG
jgi:cobalt-zinc-cadmium efflux system membrane fusion protein